MTTYTKRFLTALVIALICACTTMALAPAQTPQPPIATQTALPPTDPTAVAKGLAYDNCVACHKDIQESWLLGNHGQAISDPVKPAIPQSRKTIPATICQRTSPPICVENVIATLALEPITGN
jgi:hypothetical protein